MSGASHDSAADSVTDGGPAVTRPNYAVHVLLFAATCATTYLAGGLAFSATLMTILTCHEMGHYVVARRHGIDASLPYFIPLPPQITLGTLGAVIRMRNPIADRNKLIDVGAAGPIAGLVVAIPLLIVGLVQSPVEMSTGEGLIEGNSLLYIGLKAAVTGRYLPSSDGLDVQLSPMAFAAWVGLLITMINLIPIGQLDGGHIARGFFGNRHERLSLWLHRSLVAVGVVAAGALAIEARSTGLAWADCVAYGAKSGAPWLVWGGMLWVMRGMSGGLYHPPVHEGPLSARRRWFVIAMAIVFLAIFTPVPLRTHL